MPDFSLEDSFNGIVAGIDEAGRGPWAGPVVASAVILDRENIPAGINDSKKLTAAKREVIFEELCQCAVVGVGQASVEEIDRLNILGATKLAMTRALQALGQVPGMVLVDGNQLPELPCRGLAVVKGDSKSLSIAAASVVAKVTRDRIMTRLASEYPLYGWENNAGYGTKIHVEAINDHGITPHHRRSFKPIAKLVRG